MKVTFVIGSLGLGGKERQLIYLLNNLPKTINKQLIVLSERNEYKLDHSVLEEVIIFKRDDKYKYKTIKDIYKRIAEFSPDLIHSWDYISPILLKPMTYFKKIKLINGSIRSARPLTIFSFDYLIRKLIEEISDVNISNSKKGLEIKNISRKSNSLYIHNGFDLNKFDSSLENDQLVDFIDSSNFNVCMVGSCTPPKDYKLFIEVCEILNSKSTEQKIVFHAFGDGPLLSKYKKMIKDRSIDNIIFHGVTNNLPNILTKCDVGVLLNTKHHAEGISNAIMEYMACGLPVVATDAGGTPELVKHGVTGFLAESGNLDKVYSYLSELIESKKLRKKMGTEGRKVIKKKFSMNKMIDSYVKLYTHLEGVKNKDIT